MTPRRALWSLIVVSGLLRLGWAASLGPCNDEAYHYLFAVHPDWSYFDHPPMLAVVERVGLALIPGEVSMLRLRLGFVLLFAGSTWLMARMTARFYGPWAGFLAALGLNLTAYHFIAAGAFALPDGPLLFFWLLTLDRLAATFESPRKLGPWAGVGLAWGGALLSKYHAVFLPAGALIYLMMKPSARACLKRPGPYLAVILGLLVFTPVLVWNASHGWASFAFQGGRALGAVQFRPETLAAFLVGQAGYLLPWIWAPLAYLFFRGLRRLFRGEADAAEQFLLSQAVGPIAVFTAVSCFRTVLPHWALVGFVSLFPMLGAWYEARAAARPARLRRWLWFSAAAPVLIAALILAQTYGGVLQKGGKGTLGLLDRSKDLTLDFYGWDEIARELKRRGLLDQPGSFLFTSNWYYSGQLAFATRGSGMPVLCYHGWDARSFAFWSRPEDWIGRDGILVAINNHVNEPGCYQRYFTRLEPIGEFDVVRAGGPVRNVRLFRCVRQVVAFPFDGSRTMEQIVQFARGGAKAGPPPPR
jgi:hypothetical protein